MVSAVASGRQRNVGDVNPCKGPSEYEGNGVRQRKRFSHLYILLTALYAYG